MRVCMRVCGAVDAGAQGLNNFAETSSIMKGSPEGCVSPPALPVLRRARDFPQKKPGTDAVQPAEGISVGGGGVMGLLERCKAGRFRIDLINIARS